MGEFYPFVSESKVTLSNFKGVLEKFKHPLYNLLRSNQRTVGVR